MSRTRSPFRSLALVAAAALTTVAALSSTAPAHAASPDLLPVTVSNHTGQAGPVYLYVLGVDLNTDKLGYVNAGGTFTPWSLPGGPTPIAAPDASIAGPADGSAVTIKVPKNLSGRVYFAFGDKLDFSLVDAGLVQPAPWNKVDKNTDNLFDWSEFTFNDDGLWLNSSQVDQFAVPHEVNVTDGAGTSIKTGDVVAGGREKVIDQVKATPGYGKTVMTGRDGKVLRVLAPGKATDSGLMSTSYLDDYIDQAWSAYTSKKLTVVPFEYEPSKKFYGTTSGDTMTFTDASGAQVATFEKPTTSDVWDCDGNLAAPNNLTVGPIARTLCSALHRGTLGDSTTEPVNDAAKFYQRTATNHYSAIIHDNMTDGKAYGFAFDDVTHQESLVHSGDPQRAGIVLDPFA